MDLQYCFLLKNPYFSKDLLTSKPGQPKDFLWLNDVEWRG